MKHDVAQCCVCDAIHIDNQWYPHVGKILVSHTYCEKCLKIEMDKLKKMEEKNEPVSN